MANVELNIHVQIKELQKGLKEVQKSQKELANQSTKTHKTMQKNMSGTSKAVQGLGAAFVALFSIRAVTQLTKSIIATRSEFEKYRAVLANTLGSAEAANREFAKISEFAAETPFAVRTLTDAFVRLVNQGFKPTMKQMRLLGDLASSTGKDFIQLAEAILDAQTGEFERLKDFGIKAKKEGDKVTFTFKEQATQVDFTSKAIQEYILSLGELEGVSGAMAAVSETLGGQINNLSDKWDHLLDVLGGRTTGIFVVVIDFLGEMLEKITSMAEVKDPLQQATNSINNLKTSLAGLEKEAALDKIKFEFDAVGMTIDAVKEAIGKLESESLGKMERFFAGFNENNEDFRDQLNLENAIDSYMEFIDALEIEQKLLRDLSEDVAKGLIFKKDDVTVTDKQTKSLKQLNEERKKLIASLVLTKNLEEEETKFFDSAINSWLAYKEEVIETSEDITDQLKQDAKDKTDAEVAEYDRGVEAKKKADAKAAQEKEWRIEGTFAVASSLADLLSSMNQAAMNKELEAAEGNAKKQEEIRKKYARKQQIISIAQAIISGAEGIVKVPTAIPYPFAIPFQIALGLQTLAQIALIRGQKFERGGYDVLKGRRHAQGGVDIGIGEAEAGEGLAVFNRTATQKYGKFLPAFVKAINENNGEMGYSDGAYMISFDDSRSVKELKGIKDILNKPEIRYEGRYRIETRKGQTTRVKI